MFQSLSSLMKVAKVLKQSRVNNGALELASTQVKFEFDSSNNPIDVGFYKTFDTNSMVEEFMLLANIYVAKKIFEHFTSKSLLRKHTEPPKEKIGGLKTIVESEGFELSTENSKKLNNSLNKIVRDDDPFFNKLIRIMTTRCMHEAQYFCTKDKDELFFNHYGLSVDYYTHFTSPIRRYADVIVHRLLSAAIGYESLATSLTPSRLNDICDNLNFKNRNARNCSRNSTDFNCYLMFKDKEIIETGIIWEIGATYFSVIIPKYGIDSVIEIDDNITNIEKIDKNDYSFIKSISYKGKTLRLFNNYKFKIKVEMRGLRKLVILEIIN